MRVKTTLLGSLASASGAIFLLLTLQIILLVIDDISAGALSGKPETGWGFMISLILLPIAIVALVLFIALGRKFKNATTKPGWLLWVSSILLAVLILIGYGAYDRITRPPENPQDVQTRKDLSEVREKVHDLFYKNKGVLPSDTEAKQFLHENTTYKIVSENTFQLCGTFQKSTINDAYKEHPENAVSETIKKIVAGETLESAESMGIYGLHKAGIQCYTVELNKPGVR